MPVANHCSSATTSAGRMEHAASSAYAAKSLPDVPSDAGAPHTTSMKSTFSSSAISDIDIESLLSSFGFSMPAAGTDTDSLADDESAGSPTRSVFETDDSPVVSSIPAFPSPPTHSAFTSGATEPLSPSELPYAVDEQLFAPRQASSSSFSRKLSKLSFRKLAPPPLSRSSGASVSRGPRPLPTIDASPNTQSRDVFSSSPDVLPALASSSGSSASSSSSPRTTPTMSIEADDRTPRAATFEEAWEDQSSYRHSVMSGSSSGSSTSSPSIAGDSAFPSSNRFRWSVSTASTAFTAPLSEDSDNASRCGSSASSSCDPLIRASSACSGVTSRAMVTPPYSSRRLDDCDENDEEVVADRMSWEDFLSSEDPSLIDEDDVDDVPLYQPPPNRPLPFQSRRVTRPEPAPARVQLEQHKPSAPSLRTNARLTAPSQESLRSMRSVSSIRTASSSSSQSRKHSRPYAPALPPHLAPERGGPLPLSPMMRQPSLRSISSTSSLSSGKSSTSMRGKQSQETLRTLRSFASLSSSSTLTARG